MWQNKVEQGEARGTSTRASERGAKIGLYKLKYTGCAKLEEPFAEPGRHQKSVGLKSAFKPMP